VKSSNQPNGLAANSGISCTLQFASEQASHSSCGAINGGKDIGVVFLYRYAAQWRHLSADSAIVRFRAIPADTYRNLVHAPPETIQGKLQSALYVQPESLGEIGVIVVNRDSHEFLLCTAS
jgi:hypothetical protein